MLFRSGRALREVLDGPPVEVAAMRERCLAITRDVYNWESAVQSYLELVQSLVPSRRPWMETESKAQLG